MPKTVHLKNETQSYSMFSGLLKDFLLKLKEHSFQSKKNMSQKEAMNYPDRTFFFSNEWETGEIQSKTVFNFKMSHIGQVHSYSGVLYHFRRKMRITTV